MCELPFDPVRKRMTLVYDEGDGRYLYVKGAPEVVLDRSTMPPDEAASIEATAEVGFQGAEGAAAQRELPETSLSDALEHDLTVVGLVALEDPLARRLREPWTRRAQPGCAWR